ncbi:hypothetical protein SESBI_02761 [Sesbania bispinosa]|nr:hypothetical protein SESBI_02761 [Sesbania bispinosa]
MEDHQQSQRVTPRSLSFSLDDFLGAEGIRRSGPGTLENNNERPQAINVEPEHPQPELNLLQNLETPAGVAGNTGGDTPLVVSAFVLNSILAEQQNLANIVTHLSTIVYSRKESGTRGQVGAAKEVGDDALVTQKELRQLLQNKHSPPSTIFNLEPPLADTVTMVPYPSGYQPPTFRKFDGTGSAKEPIMSFLDYLGIYRSNKHLRLKEFCKSLSGRVFTWYAKLRPYSIEMWEYLVMEFYGKFLEKEGALHIMDLGRVKQKVGEGLVAFIKLYRDRALKCKETLPEADLVYGYIKNIEDGSQIFLSLSGITTFAELMRKTVDVADAMKRHGKRTKGSEDMFDVCVAEERERKKMFKNSHSHGKVMTYNANEAPPINLSRLQVCHLVEEWVKDGTLRLKVSKAPLTKEQYDSPEYCVLHKTNSHATLDCWTIRRAFHKQVKLGKVLLPEEE